MAMVVVELCVPRRASFRVHVKWLHHLSLLAGRERKELSCRPWPSLSSCPLLPTIHGSGHTTRANSRPSTPNPTQQPWKLHKSMHKLNKEDETRSPIYDKSGKQIIKTKKKSKQQNHLWKRKVGGYSGTQARRLVNTVMCLSNVKEDVYGALDNWVAFQQEFPMVAVRKALDYLKKKEQWLRIIQIFKWMMSKGQGATFSTYELTLTAFDMVGRLEEAEAQWEKLIAKYTRSIPKTMYCRIISMYVRHRMPHKLIEVVEKMEEFGVKPDACLVKKIANAYMEMGLNERLKAFVNRYPIAQKDYKLSNQKHYELSNQKHYKLSNERSYKSLTNDSEKRGESNKINIRKAEILPDSSDQYGKLTDLVIGTM